MYDLIHRDSNAENDNSADGLVYFDDSKDLLESFKCAILSARGGLVRINNPGGNDKISRNGLHIFMLVLEPTRPPDEYKRIGIAYRHISLDCENTRDFPDKSLIRIV